MELHFSHYVIFSFFVLFTIIIIGLYFFKRNYTREKYAFFVTVYLFIIASSLVGSFLNSANIYIDSINFIAIKLGQSPIDYTANSSDKILAVIVYLVFGYFSLTMHREWKGAKSQREYDIKNAGGNVTLASDAVFAVTQFASRNEIEVHEEQKKKEEIYLEIKKNLPWHEAVGEYLSITSQQYKIDLSSDWYPEEKIIFCSYGKNNQDYFIHCCKSVQEINVGLFFDFISQNKSSSENQRKIILVAGEGNPYEIDHDHETVEVKFETQLINNLVDFDNYTSRLVAAFETDPISINSDLCLKDIYTECKFRKFGRFDIDEPIDASENEILTWVKEKSSRQISILGEYGQGKSVLALKVAYELLSNVEEYGRFPVLINLGGASPRNDSQIDMLAKWAAIYGLNPHAILLLHKMGKIVLIFDGFDEMDLVVDAGIRFDHFKNLWSFASEPKSKIIITGRPNFFLDDNELLSSLNVCKEAREMPFTDVYYVEKFDKEKIENTLRCFPNDTKSEIVDLLDKSNASGSFSDLISRPSTLFFAASIWEEISQKTDVQNITSSDVIDAFINHAYERQQMKEGGGFLSSLEREYFMVGVAIRMFERTQNSNSLKVDDFSKCVLQLIDSFPAKLYELETTFNQKNKGFKERLQDTAKLHETVKRDVSSCGILVNDITSLDRLKFAHKSFLEFIVSKYFLYTLGLPVGQKLEIIFKALVPRSATYILLTNLIHNFTYEHVKFAAETHAKTCVEEDDHYFNTKRKMVLLFSAGMIRGMKSSLEDKSVQLNNKVLNFSLIFLKKFALGLASFPLTIVQLYGNMFGMRRLLYRTAFYNQLFIEMNKTFHDVGTVNTDDILGNSDEFANTPFFIKFFKQLFE